MLVARPSTPLDSAPTFASNALMHGDSLDKLWFQVEMERGAKLRTSTGCRLLRGSRTNQSGPHDQIKVRLLRTSTYSKAHLTTSIREVIPEFDRSGQKQTGWVRIKITRLAFAMILTMHPHPFIRPDTRWEPANCLYAGQSDGLSIAGMPFRFIVLKRLAFPPIPKLSESFDSTNPFPSLSVLTCAPP